MIVSSSVFRRHPNRSSVLTVALALATVSAHALERVNLNNGFSYDCTHHEPVDAEHVRLYLYTADSTDPSKNYTVIASKQIASIEPLPDPPRATNGSATRTTCGDKRNVPDLLAKAGAQHNIDVELLASVVKAESGFHANAVSRTGARGLMQLMPATAHTLGVNDAFQPDQNIAGGAAYLDYLLTRYHDDISLALAAYNAGPGAVDRYHGVPPFRETRAYVARVENEFIRRKHRAASSLLTATCRHHARTSPRHSRLRRQLPSNRRAYLLAALLLLALCLWLRRGHHLRFDCALTSLSSSTPSPGSASRWAIACIYASHLLRALRWSVLLAPVRKTPALHLLPAQLIGFTAVALFGRFADLGVHASSPAACTPPSPRRSRSTPSSAPSISPPPPSSSP